MVFFLLAFDAFLPTLFYFVLVIDLSNKGKTELHFLSGADFMTASWPVSIVFLFF